MVSIEKVSSHKELNDLMTREELARKLHTMLVPFEDSITEIEAGIDYAMDPSGSRGGFIVTAIEEGELVGALVMLNTNMKDYVPENLLLYVAVDGSHRGKGIGTKLIQKAIENCTGNVKLHVEYHNPAKKLYERIGFVSKYADMRYANE